METIHNTPALRHAEPSIWLQENEDAAASDDGHVAVARYHQGEAGPVVYLSPLMEAAPDLYEAARAEHDPQLIGVTDTTTGMWTCLRTGSRYGSAENCPTCQIILRIDAAR